MKALKFSLTSAAASYGRAGRDAARGAAEFEAQARRRTERQGSTARATDRTIDEKGGATMRRATMAAQCGVLSVALLALCTGPGFAQSTTTTTVSGNTVDSGNHSNNGNVGQVGANNTNVKGNNNTTQQTSLSSRNTNSNRNSNANSNRNSNSNANKNTSTSSATASGNTGNNLSINDSTPSTQTINNVPNVYAPGLTAAGTEVCLGSLSAGGAGAGFGLTVGGTMVDRECQLRLNAKTLAVLGYRVAAREEMCLDPEVRAAMASAGTPCAADSGAPVQARAEYDAPVASTGANLSTVAAAPAPQASAPAAAPGCHKAYQLLSGWYDVCPPGAEAVYASADNLPAPADNVPAEAAAPAPQDLAPASAPGCHKEYQLFGGWYDKCD